MKPRSSRVETEGRRCRRALTGIDPIEERRRLTLPAMLEHGVGMQEEPPRKPRTLCSGIQLTAAAWL